MLATDTREQAEAREKEARFAGVTHYWDENQLVGKLFKPVLGIKRGALAWDVYLFFGKEAVWNERAPSVASWSHQLAGADPKRFSGGRLGERLSADFRAVQGLPEASEKSDPEPIGERITVDPAKLSTVATLLLEDALAATRADLPESERPAFDELAAQIRKRYAALEAKGGFEIPKGLRLRSGIVAVPKPTCLPSPPK